MATADSERRRRHTRCHSALLLIAMAALLSYCGWIVAEWDGILWSLVGGATMLVLVRRVPPGLVLRAIGARPVARWEAPVLYEILDTLCRRTGLDRVPHLCWVGERFPVAFTIGGGEATTIALSEELVCGMTAREIRGILAHEIIHVRNDDIALMQLAMVVGQLTRTVSQIAFLLVFFSLFPPEGAPALERAKRRIRQTRWYELARAFGRLVSERGGALAPDGRLRDNVIAIGGGPGIWKPRTAALAMQERPASASILVCRPSRSPTRIRPRS